MEEIKTIKKEETSEIVIEKSKFIAFIFPCLNKENANEILDDLHIKYPDATHICYAYIINDNVMLYKSSDDGEPSGTAGAPILNIIRKKELVNVLVAVVRYFGGIKLGAGGLTRAYSNSAIEVTNKANVITLTNASIYEIGFEYDKTKVVDEFLRINKIEVSNKDYNDIVIYKIVTYDKNIIDLLDNKKDYYKYNLTYKGETKVIK